MNTPLKQLNIPLFGLGFRPFFLFGSLHSILVMAVWVLVYTAVIPGFSGMNSIIWHIHEMVFGFAGAIIAGFILTASANWVGIRGLHGLKLFGLFFCWFIGRVVYFMVPFKLISMSWIVLDLLWMPLLILVLAPPLVRAGKWKNTGLLFILLGLFICQVLLSFHLFGFNAEIFYEAGYVSPFFVILLIVIVGGRITPLFTRNKYGVEVIQHPVWEWSALLSFYLFMIILLVFGWGETAGWAALIVAFCNLVRLSGWNGLVTWKDPLYWVMHLAYFFIPLGFTILWLSLSFNLFSRSIANHVFNTGVIGLFILGMITRVSKGHTGRPIQSDSFIVTAYFLLLGSVIFRTLIPYLFPHWGLNAVVVSGITWILAFSIFLIRFSGMLFTVRPDGRPG